MTTIFNKMLFSFGEDLISTMVLMRYGRGGGGYNLLPGVRVRFALGLVSFRLSPTAIEQQQQNTVITR